MDKHSNFLPVDDMHSVYIHGYYSSVMAVSEKKTINDLTKLCHDFLNISAVSAKNQSHNVPIIIGSDTIPISESWERIVYPSEYGPDRILFVDHSTRKILIAEPVGSWRTLQMLRTIRNILRWEAFVAGDLFLHAGLVDTNGSGIAYVGEKKSGKTSSICAALLTTGSRLVSNDDLTIRAENRHLIGYGWPRTVNVRTDTIMALQQSKPEFFELVAKAKHPSNRWPDSHNQRVMCSSDQKFPNFIWVYPAELTNTLGSTITRESQVKAVIFPHFDDSVDKPYLREIDPTEAAALILPHIEDKAVENDPFLRDWYIDEGKETRVDITEKLLRTASFFQLKQSMALLQEASELVQRTLA